MKAVNPWPAGTECPLKDFDRFKEDLNHASYHNAAEGGGEASLARSCERAAAEVAIENEWPLWVIKRMFGEIKPLVDYDGWLQTYVNLLFEGYQK